ncbi:hypothetical protein ACFCX0_03300 [Streptomyces sp. NPDC056352]|uniref:hypothetical protein n=1 Tax=Streptomyces sp. NPDC056352 TaxID=3345791 RepID=UPI0035E16F3D
MKILRHALAGLTAALAAVAIPATPAAADPRPEAQTTVLVRVDLPVDTPVISDDFGWG